MPAEKLADPNPPQATIPQKEPQKEVVEINEQMFKSFTLKSIRERKEILQKLKPLDDANQLNLLKEPFSENDLMIEWFNFAKKMEQQGEKLIYSLFTLNKPQLVNNTKIIHTVPNASSKLEFDRIRLDLLGHLKNKLHNHLIELEIEEDHEGEIAATKLFNKEDKLKRFIEINPDILLLKKTFDLDLG